MFKIPMVHSPSLCESFTAISSWTICKFYNGMKSLVQKVFDSNENQMTLSWTGSVPDLNGSDEAGLLACIIKY